MTVYKRENSEIYSYDFKLDGDRYSGSTETSILDVALAFESKIKEEILSTSGFCRGIIRRAKRRITGNEKAKTGYVYMIKSGYFIKIGHSHEPEQRVKKINTSTPHDSELLFYLRGSVTLERQLHKEFAACHYKREWFFLCGKLKHFVEEFERRSPLDDKQAGPPESTFYADVVSISG